MHSADRRLVITLCALAALLVVAVIWRLHVGVGTLESATTGAIIFDLRLDAVLVAALVGAALSVGGVLSQGLFRNPLAAPSIIGVGAGATLGGMLALAGYELALRGGARVLPAELFLPLGCILGALGALGVLLLTMRYARDTLTVLLAGIIMGMFLTSVGSFVRALLADKWELSRAVMTFTMGDISGTGTRHILLAAPLVLAGLLAALLLGRQLDLLLAGEEEAAALGLDIAATRFWVVVWTALLVAAAVAIGGNVAFVGLMVPHLVRKAVGTNHRRLIPVAALAGAGFVILCDCVAVSLGGGSVIPVGVITGLVGAPLFLYLLVGQRRAGSWS